MFMCPEKDQADSGNAGRPDELPGDDSQGSTGVYRSTKDRVDAIELTDDELEEIAGGLLDGADESFVDDHPESTPE